MRKKQKRKLFNFIIFLFVGLLLFRRLEAMQSVSYQTYGIYGIDDLKEIAKETADKYSYGANKDNLYKMLLETAVVETNAGRAAMDTNRNYGRSIMQFDKVGYDEAIRMRQKKGDRDFQYEVNKGYMSDELQKNPRFAMYLARMFYLGKSEPIPSTLENRALYWKRYYNTLLGAGSIEKYLDLVYKNLGKDWK